MLFGEGGVGQDVFSRCVHHLSQFGGAITQGVGDGLPLLMSLLSGFLGKDRLDHGDDCGALLGGYMGERVAHPMDPAALLGCVENLAGGGA